MAKIYIVLVHVVSSCEEIRLDATAFNNFDEAKSLFDYIVADETEHAKKQGFVFDNDNNDTSFLTFEDGHFCENNTSVQLIEQNL